MVAYCCKSVSWYDLPQEHPRRPRGKSWGGPLPFLPVPTPSAVVFRSPQFPACPMICPGSPRMPQEQMNLLAIGLNLDHSWLRWGLSGAPFMKAAYWRSCDLWPHSSAINLLLWWKKNQCFSSPAMPQAVPLELCWIRVVVSVILCLFMRDLLCRTLSWEQILLAGEVLYWSLKKHNIQ